MMNFSTSSLMLNLVLFAAGFWILIKGSDIFIDAAAGIARKYNVSELAIGLTLVSIGTSLPELASSVYASVIGEPAFVVGNVVGSITTNITLILGIGVVLSGKMFFSPKLLSRDAVFMFLIFLLTVAMTCFGTVAAVGDGVAVPGIGRWEGLLLLFLAVLYCHHLLKHPEDAAVDPAVLAEEEARATAAVAPNTTIARYLLWLIIGLVMVMAGSKLLLDNVIWAANQLKVSTMIISITLVAFGTSLPELAVTVAGVLKKRHDMAIGNIIGSNTFNILLIFGSCAVIHPLEITGSAGAINLGIMVLSGVALLLSMFFGRKLTRRDGVILLLLYGVFLVYNCRQLLFG
jgi:cation:H+ antiporter